MFDKILVANRGEIACRIFKTCRRLGIRSVAVFSEADRDALHVRLSDEAVMIGAASARDSYLRTDRIIAAALKAGAQAIHPGYGFLSEKPELVKACNENGLVFIGPSAAALDAMGDKIRAKAIARAAGVPVVPGYDGAEQSVEALRKAALDIGLPVMIKASAGGGGKGIRRVETEAELDAAIETARREAEGAFGDGRLLVERFIRLPRHIEVQLAGDRHGNIVHLFERDCSIQRSNQKLIEEAPAPGLADATRRDLFAHATALARAISYDSLGTAEFLVDAETGSAYFLEMNTRLQVEHPVTEAVTGLDLVEWQMRIAADEVLPLRQDAIRCTGHAIEARLTAERADEDFRSDIGLITAFEAPTSLRVDTGVERGSDVSVHYDSLLAKLIAHAPDRQAAVALLAAGLDETFVSGPSTIRGFLIDAVRSPAFGAGAVTTRFIEECFPGGWRRDAAREPHVQAAAGLVWLDRRKSGAASDPWHMLGDFRNTGSAARNGPSHLLIREGGDAAVRLSVGAMAMGKRRVTVGGQRADLHVSRQGETTFRVLSDGVSHMIRAVADAQGVSVAFGSIDARFEIIAAVDERADNRGSRSTVSSDLVAEMPGLVSAIHVKVGDDVVAGASIAILESMKLFIDLKAPVSGRVSRIGAKPGETVGIGHLLIAIDPETIAAELPR